MTYVYVVQGLYASAYGWEDVDEADSRKDAQESLRLYRENEPTYAHRLIRRREGDEN